ncbi:ABC transporter ATP-binding protein [Bacillus sp. V33-4]|uniref:ABC transporter ATP-binding protein n=1 Tax=Bacillus sp. V33-4 TaxID=2054169 RepID=UPI000C7644C0|nr:ABC transporter ATP-binding protein [Bacillus sp. V33-4]PLR80712.1 ABC transporter ATP-binding protein [Bacillus sp. V33-4]
MIQAEQIKKKYGDRLVIKGINLDVQKNQILAVIGPNGAGKSTILEIVIGLRSYDAGRIKYWSGNYKSQMGVQLQSVPFFPGLSAKQNLQLFAAFYHKKLSANKAVAILEECGLKEAANTEAAKLSGGQQKRLAIAASLVHDPEIVFLDEPTSALDPRSRQEIHHIVKKLFNNGKTIVFTSHDMDEVMKLATTVVMVNDGQVIAQGHAEELCLAYNVHHLEQLYLKLTEKEVDHA